MSLISSPTFGQFEKYLIQTIERHPYVNEQPYFQKKKCHWMRPPDSPSFIRETISFWKMLKLNSFLFIFVACQLTFIFIALIKFFFAALHKKCLFCLTATCYSRIKFQILKTWWWLAHFEIFNKTFMLFVQ